MLYNNRVRASAQDSTEVLYKRWFPQDDRLGGSFALPLTDEQRAALRVDLFPLDNTVIKARSPFSRLKAASARRTSAVISIYENEFRVQRFVTPFRVKPTRRGDVVGFSDRSRGRMMAFYNRLRWPDGVAHFVTLTYPDEFERDPKRVKAQLKALKMRLLRKFESIGGSWRMEMKRRKSGVNAGQVVPHFHLMLFKTGWDDCQLWDWLRNAWTDILSAAGVVTAENYLKHLEHGVHVREVNDRKQAIIYISKYMEKSEDDAAALGRLWGWFGALDASPYKKLVLTGLETVAYLKRAVVAELIHRRKEFNALGWQLDWRVKWQGYKVWGLGLDTCEKLLASVAAWFGPDVGRLALKRVRGPDGRMSFNLTDTLWEYFEQDERLV